MCGYLCTAVFNSIVCNMGDTAVSLTLIETCPLKVASDEQNEQENIATLSRDPRPLPPKLPIDQRSPAATTPAAVQKSASVSSPVRSILTRKAKSLTDATSVDSNITLTGSTILNAVDPATVYAAQTFIASLEGQVCILKGDVLTVMDDTNAFWWLVRCIKTGEVGYVPAETTEVRTIKGL
jgi:hypothetical protein